MSKLFKFTIALIIFFSVAVVYYFYIWITFKSEKPLSGDKNLVVYNDKLIGQELIKNKNKLY